MPTHDQAAGDREHPADAAQRARVTMSPSRPGREEHDVQAEDVARDVARHEHAVARSGSRRRARERGRTGAQLLDSAADAASAVPRSGCRSRITARSPSCAITRSSSSTRSTSGRDRGGVELLHGTGTRLVVRGILDRSFHRPPHPSFAARGKVIVGETFGPADAPVVPRSLGRGCRMPSPVRGTITSLGELRYRTKGSSFGRYGAPGTT